MHLAYAFSPTFTFTLRCQAQNERPPRVDKAFDVVLSWSSQRHLLGLFLVLFPSSELVPFEDSEVVVPNSLPPARDSLVATPPVARDITSVVSGSTVQASGAPDSPVHSNDAAVASDLGGASDSGVIAMDESDGPNAEIAPSSPSPDPAAPSQSTPNVPETVSQSPIIHRRVSDLQIARLHDAYQDCVRQLRLFFKVCTDVNESRMLFLSFLSLIL